VPFDLKHP